MLTLWKRLTALFRRSQLEEDLQDEIATHLAMQEEEFRQRGMSPSEARAAARREFGGVAQAQELYRERRGIPWIETFARDVHYALRGLRRNPGFTVAAVLSLALGIGANTSIFSLFHALMLRLLPVDRPAELILLHIGKGGAGFASDGLYRQLAARTDLFAGVLARSAGGRERFYRPEGGRPETAGMEGVSANYFEVLGLKPALGRFFTESDGRAWNEPQFVVLGYDFWRNRFGADPSVLGTTLRTDRTLLTIVGIAPPGFRGITVENRTEVWYARRIGKSTGASSLFLMARARPDISRRHLQAALDVFMRQFGIATWGAAPSTPFIREAMEQKIEIQDGGIGLSFLRAEFGKPLEALMAVVAVVLLATCANIAHLLLARGAARRREIALRSALGASRGRLIRQGLTESLVIGGMGCALGMLGAVWGGQYLLLFIPSWRAGDLDVSPDAAVLAFTLAISLAAALLFGLAPAFRSTAIDPVEGLRSDSAGAGRPTLQRVLVAAEVALSVILVAMAGLFSHSLSQLREVDLGFHHDSVITFWLNFPSRWKEADEQAALQRFLAATATEPGVASVSYTSPDLLQGESWGGAVRVAGSDRTARQPGKVHIVAVGPHFLETVGAVPLQGRDFTSSDHATAPKVVMVNQAFVRAFLDGAPTPLAHMMTFSSEEAQPRQIVGVLRDIVHRDLKHPAEPIVYVPASQIESPVGISVLVRGSLPPSATVQAVRRSLSQIDPQLEATSPQTVRHRLDETIFEERMLATLGQFFGGLALLLAAIGLYGVVACAVTQRRREIGVRIALGAERLHVLQLILRDALGLVVGGLAVGLGLALLAARAAGSILFGIRSDPASFAGTACVLLLVGAAAAFLPARRAASIDPMQALRQDG